MPPKNENGVPRRIKQLFEGFGFREVPQHHGWVQRKIGTISEPGLLEEVWLLESYGYEQDMNERNGISPEMQEIYLVHRF